MLQRKKAFILLVFLLFVFTFAAGTADAKGDEYKAIVKHLKSKYKAKKVKIPFVWLARFAVSVVHPAGVKSFSITIFEDLKFSRETLDTEMQAVMRNSFGPEWIPILRVRSRDGEQVYMYMREAGSSVRIALVTIDKEQAAVIRATVNPEKLADFINNPKIFGISLGDTEKQVNTQKPDSDEDTETEEKKDVPKNDNDRL